MSIPCCPQGGVAFVQGHTDRPEMAGLDVRHHLGGMAFTHREVAAHQGLDRIAPPVKGTKVIGKFTRFAMAFSLSYVHNAGYNGCGGGDSIAGIGVGNQILHRLNQVFSAHADDYRMNREPGDRGEILEKVIGHFLEVLHGQIGARSL